MGCFKIYVLLINIMHEIMKIFLNTLKRFLPLQPAEGIRIERLGKGGRYLKVY